MTAMSAIDSDKLGLPAGHNANDIFQDGLIPQAPEVLKNIDGSGCGSIETESARWFKSASLHAELAAVDDDRASTHGASDKVVASQDKLLINECLAYDLGQIDAVIVHLHTPIFIDRIVIEGSDGIVIGMAGGVSA